jgi:hypothetical protein
LKKKWSELYSWYPVDFDMAPSFMEYVGRIFSKKHYGKMKKTWR